MRNDYITRLVHICLDIANIADERGEVDKPYFEELGLGYRALSGILRRGCKEIIDLQNNYHGAIEAKNLAMIGEKEAHDVLEELPSAQPEQRWIPCSERLPEERDWYLGIFKEPDTGWINPLPFICDYVGSETKATTKEYWILRGFTDRDEHIDYYFNLECVAWMPLPERFAGR